MPRPIWSGSVSFGLVSVPVKLYSAQSPKEVRFHMLHDKDGGRIHQKRVCSVDGQEVPWEHVVKGFEVSKGKSVTVTKDELEAFSPKANKAIEIEDFVALEQIDPIFYENTYYLVPDKGAAKPYALLVEAMKRTGKVGIARIVIRTKQSLCAVRPMGRVLAVSLMLYADEVVDIEDLDGLPASSAKPGERELKMAEQLIASLDAKFDPKKYKDDYREQVMALIEKKQAGEEIASDEPLEKSGKVVDLMEALRRSLSAAKSDKPAKGAKADKAPAAPRHRGPHRARAKPTAKRAKRK
jgi:DNA end-binding protein Ku